MKLGFCGLGLMGAAMVQRLLKAGHEVKVWNRSREKAEPLAALGAQVVSTPREAAEGADGVLLCLFDAKAAEAVVFGADGTAFHSYIAFDGIRVERPERAFSGIFVAASIRRSTFPP